MAFAVLEAAMGYSSSWLVQASMFEESADLVEILRFRGANIAVQYREDFMHTWSEPTSSLSKIASRVPSGRYLKEARSQS